jgi:hypothetical protein
VESWVAAVNEGKVPNVDDTWSNVCQAECRKQVASRQAVYLEQQQAHILSRYVCVCVCICACMSVPFLVTWCSNGTRT